MGGGVAAVAFVQDRGWGRSRVPRAPALAAARSGAFSTARPEPGESPPPSLLCISRPVPDSGVQGTRGWSLGSGGTWPGLRRAGSPCPACDLAHRWPQRHRLGAWRGRAGVGRSGEAEFWAPGAWRGSLRESLRERPSGLPHRRGPGSVSLWPEGAASRSRVWARGSQLPFAPRSRDGGRPASSVWKGAPEGTPREGPFPWTHLRTEILQPRVLVRMSPHGSTSPQIFPGLPPRDGNTDALRFHLFTVLCNRRTRKEDGY